MWHVAHRLEPKWLQWGSFGIFLVESLLFVQVCIGFGAFEPCNFFHLEKLSGLDFFNGCVLQWLVCGIVWCCLALLSCLVIQVLCVV